MLVVGPQEGDLARRLERGRATAAVPQQLVLARRGAAAVALALAYDDPGVIDLAQPLVRHARDVGLGHALVADEPPRPAWGRRGRRRP